MRSLWFDGGDAVGKTQRSEGEKWKNTLILGSEITTSLDMKEEREKEK